MSLYVSEPKRLRSSSGHGVGWRTGVVCELSVFLPTALYALRLSVGAGLFTNHLFDWQ